MPNVISKLQLKTSLSQLEPHTVHSIAIKLVWVVLAVGLLALAGNLVGTHITQAEAWIDQQGALAPLVYVLIYCLCVSCFVSVDVLSFAAGVMFGLWWGFLYAYIGSFLSGALMFFIAHHLGRNRLDQFIQQHPKLARMDNATSKHGLKIMFLLRLTPLPFAPLSYALSRTRVSFVAYILACAGMFLTNFVSVYYGFVAQHIGKLADGHDRLPSSHYLGMFSMVLLSIVLTVIIGRMAHKAIAED